MGRNKEKYELFISCKLLMIIAGVWSNKIKFSSDYKRKAYKMYSIGGQLYYISCVIPFVIKLYQTITMKDIETLTATLKSVTFITTIIAKMSLCQTEKITKLISSAMEEEKAILCREDTHIKDIYSVHAKYCSAVVKVLVSALYISGITCIAEAFYETHQYFQDFNYLYAINKTLAESLKKPHPVQFWFPFDKDKHYVWAMTYECVHIIQSLIFNGAAQALINTAMIFLQAELKILQHCLTHYDKYYLKNLNIGNISVQTLKIFIIKHQKIIKWVEDFNHSFQYILLLEYSVTSIMLATALIELYQGDNLPFNSLFFMLCSMQLFILAWNANEILIESSSGLMNSLYDSHWYVEEENKTKVLIHIMMMRSLKPLAISIGPFGIMTMNAALSRMKLAYSVLSVMSNTK
uniref:Odorant receptor n=1 Tax=Eucryptorrhynchus scrobiculatus TaxID=1552824 RepID=A0A8F4RQ49_EUCSC|nr:odorant receptor 15 [Eucryptorrhynchus scrobiculatus]